MIRRKRGKVDDADVTEAQRELAAARVKQREVEDHTPEVVRVVSESREHQRLNGFETLFRQGLRGV
jgi:hypothetical protein